MHFYALRNFFLLYFIFIRIEFNTGYERKHVVIAIVPKVLTLTSSMCPLVKIKCLRKIL